MKQIVFIPGMTEWVTVMCHAELWTTFRKLNQSNKGFQTFPIFNNPGPSLWRRKHDLTDLMKSFTERRELSVLLLGFVWLSIRLRPLFSFTLQLESWIMIVTLPPPSEEFIYNCNSPVRFNEGEKWSWSQNSSQMQQLFWLQYAVFSRAILWNFLINIIAKKFVVMDR